MRALDCQVAVVGAGPYGLAVTAQLRRHGLDVCVLGDPMSFWRTMPRGMKLRSNRRATNVIELHGENSLAAYEGEVGVELAFPLPLEDFVAYGHWVQERVAPDVLRGRVDEISKANGVFQLSCDDGTEIRAGRVVVAAGIAAFPHRPAVFDDLPPHLVTHTADHDDLSVFAGRRVAVIGGGQSALESAALLSEQGASVEVFVRRPQIVWLLGGARRVGRHVARVVYAPTDVGPLWYSRLVASVELFRRLPRTLQVSIAARCVRPAGARWLRDRIANVSLTLGCEIARARPLGSGVELELTDGTSRHVDHVMLATGYKVDIARYGLLAEPLLEGVRVHLGYPVLRKGLETSVPGLHVVGAPAAWSFGPTMRFVSGSWYAAREVARAAKQSP